MHTTRQKRPDRVIYKWKKITVKLYLEPDMVLSDKVVIFNDDSIKDNAVILPLSEIPNLIKALNEIMEVK